jgi:hypothetical protein
MQINQTPIFTPEYPAEKKSTGPWGFWQTICFGLVIIFSYVISQTIAEGAFVVNNYISNQGESISQLMNSLTTNGNAIATAIFVSTAIGAGFTILFIKIRKGISFKEYLALHTLKVKTVFIVFVVAVALAIIAGFATSGLSQSKFTDQLTQAYKTSTIPVLIAAVIFAPIFEEMFFRGFLFAGFRASRVGVTGAILITAVLWALLHATQYGIGELLIIFGLGIAFGIVRWKTNSLYATLGMHSLWNLLSLVLTMIYIPGRIH